MRGHIRERKPGTWELAFDVGYDVDLDTGERRRKQKFVTFHGTKRKAERKLRELVGDVEKGGFVEPSRITVGEWLSTWFKSHRESLKPRTRETYLHVLESHLRPGLGSIALQRLTSINIEHYYQTKREEEKRLSESTLAMHQAILHRALSSAKKKRLVHENQAQLVDGKPKHRRAGDGIRGQCWEASEARQFLATARKAGPQQGAFYTLALELGLRKAELCGLKWEDIDLDECEVVIARQLVKPGSSPVFGDPKSDSGRRTLDISVDTAKLLAAHRKHQAEFKMRHRDSHRDHGLVFAKETGTALGDPLQMNNLGQREFAKLVEEAEVRPIKFHGLRHTSATLALNAGVPVKVVSHRLGHGRTQITMDIYAHALPTAQKDAAAKMASLLR